MSRSAPGSLRSWWRLIRLVPWLAALPPRPQRSPRPSSGPGRSPARWPSGNRSPGRQTPGSRLAACRPSWSSQPPARAPTPLRKASASTKSAIWPSTLLLHMRRMTGPPTTSKSESALRTAHAEAVWALLAEAQAWAFLAEPQTWAFLAAPASPSNADIVDALPCAAMLVMAAPFHSLRSARPYPERRPDLRTRNSLAGSRKKPSQTISSDLPTTSARSDSSTQCERNSCTAISPYFCAASAVLALMQRLTRTLRVFPM